MKSIATALGLALLLVAAARAFPTARWTSIYNPSELFRAQQQQQCQVRPATIGCRSARLALNNGRHFSHVHICPAPGSSNPPDLCYNTKLPRCCPRNLGRPELSCATRTTLKFGDETVEVEIHLNSTSGTHCIAFDSAHQNIQSCCPIRGNECEVPNPPVCVPKRDIYFVVDSTDSIDDNIFCRFGYVLQLIVAAINPRGLDAARVAAILFRFGREYDDRDLFTLDDACETIVNGNIRQVVYEYFGVKHLGLSRSSLTYPNVRATTTLPNSALFDAASNIATVSKGNNRSASVITLTDGKSHQDVSHAVNLLKTLSDPLIAAGIGLNVSVDDLTKLASNLSTVVYEPDRDEAISFGKRIVEIMRDTGALCADEAANILRSLNAANESNLNEYCKRCMWKRDSDMSPRDVLECKKRYPACGKRDLIMQAFEDVPQQQGSNHGLSEWERMMLRGEIEKAVEDVIARVEG